ncbi:MAG: hypothetical protein P4L87_07960 [Formivibrio sp.]|nr:hypothetical protein [Formivibrio sp.]
MSGLTGRNPVEAFEKFTTHLGKLINQTISDAPLSYIVVDDKHNRAYLSFRRHDSPIAAPLLSQGLYLFLGQVVTVVPEDKNWRLKTLQYRYWIQADTDQNTQKWFFRFEYSSPNIKPTQSPRHHLHIPCALSCGKESIQLDRTHIPTGWVTVEELIRFLIVELKVKCKTKKWEQLLFDSEDKFREWTARTI